MFLSTDKICNVSLGRMYSHRKANQSSLMVQTISKGMNVISECAMKTASLIVGRVKEEVCKPAAANKENYTVR